MDSVSERIIALRAQSEEIDRQLAVHAVEHAHLRRTISDMMNSTGHHNPQHMASVWARIDQLQASHAALQASHAALTAKLVQHSLAMSDFRLPTADPMSNTSGYESFDVDTYATGPVFDTYDDEEEEEMDEYICISMDEHDNVPIGLVPRIVITANKDGGRYRGIINEKVTQHFKFETPPQPDIPGNCENWLLLARSRNVSPIIQGRLPCFLPVPFACFLTVKDHVNLPHTVTSLLQDLGDVLPEGLTRIPDDYGAPPTFNVTDISPYTSPASNDEDEAGTLRSQEGEIDSNMHGRVNQRPPRKRLKQRVKPCASSELLQAIWFWTVFGKTDITMAKKLIS